jgi:hypothetical protein
MYIIIILEYFITIYIIFSIFIFNITLDNKIIYYDNIPINYKKYTKINKQFN